MAQERKTSGSRTEEERSLQPRRQGGLVRRDPFEDFWRWDPFNMFGRFNEQMDRWFGDVGTSPWWRHQRETGVWAPQIETFQKGDQFTIRADLPGLKRENIEVEVTDDRVTIQGERRDEHEEEKEGYYRSERSYGSFCRVVPLPEGALTETARANFKHGVLEVTVQAPPRDVSRGRKIEIGETTEKAASKAGSESR